MAFAFLDPRASASPWPHHPCLCRVRWAPWAWRQSCSASWSWPLPTPCPLCPCLLLTKTAEVARLLLLSPHDSACHRCFPWGAYSGSWGRCGWAARTPAPGVPTQELEAATIRHPSWQPGPLSGPFPHQHPPHGPSPAGSASHRHWVLACPLHPRGHGPGPSPCPPSTDSNQTLLVALPA